MKESDAPLPFHDPASANASPPPILRALHHLPPPNPSAFLHPHPPVTAPLPPKNVLRNLRCPSLSPALHPPHLPPNPPVRQPPLSRAQGPPSVRNGLRCHGDLQLDRLAEGENWRGEGLKVFMFVFGARSETGGPCSSLGRRGFIFFLYPSLSLSLSFSPSSSCCSILSSSPFPDLLRRPNQQDHSPPPLHHLSRHVPRRSPS